MPSRFTIDLLFALVGGDDIISRVQQTPQDHPMLHRESVEHNLTLAPNISTRARSGLQHTEVSIARQDK